ncbi:hypothetical protein KCP71_00940 [Salmonella enterica subsp. enterica]|nr:hypothetical protein KCP71_00940 [Salmonella enterica subsp. enterica]
MIVGMRTPLLSDVCCTSTARQFRPRRGVSTVWHTDQRPQRTATRQPGFRPLKRIPFFFAS